MLEGYLPVLKVLFKDKFRTGTFFGFKRSEDKKKKSKAAKFFTVIGIAVLVLLISVYLIAFIVFGSYESVKSGLHKEFLILLISASQLIVFFFGISAVMGYLYFSKDNSLLSTLPINTRSIFLAKFSMAYIAEFFISAYFLLVSLVTYAITLAANGVPVGIEYYIFMPICIIAAPIVPLLLVTFISIPVMHIVRLLKRNPLVQSLVVSTIFIGIMIVYFGLLRSFTNMIPDEGDFQMPSGILATLKNVRNIFVFNVPIVEAMTGSKIAANISAYLAINIGGLALAVFLSSFFYKKSMKLIIEGSGADKPKGKITKSEQKPLGLSFLRKELKTLFYTPMIFMQSVMGVVMAPIITLVLGSTFTNISGAEAVDKDILYSAGFVLYLAGLMSNATNMIAMIGFSREGRHLLVLKSLPISAKQMVDSKLSIALLQGVLSSFLVSVIFTVTNNFNFLFGIGIFATLITLSIAMSCFSLQNDLKNPNLSWKNITELTKNNKKSLRPALTIVGLGLLYLILGSIFAFTDSISYPIASISFFASCLLLNSILMIVFYKKLYDNPEELLKQIEG